MNFTLRLEKKRGKAVLHKLISAHLLQNMPLQELCMKNYYYLYL